MSCPDHSRHGDLLVRGFFCRRRDAIFDIRLQDIDARTCVNKDPQQCLIASENSKKLKRQCLKKCGKQRRDFVPFVVSLDGMFGTKAINTLKQIAQILIEKWWCPCSSIFGCLKSRMSIAVVHAANLCLRGARMKNHSLDNRRCLWNEEGLCRLHNQHF